MFSYDFQEYFKNSFGVVPLTQTDRMKNLLPWILMTFPKKILSLFFIFNLWKNHDPENILSSEGNPIIFWIFFGRFII
jgi:hypothetical protein